MAKRPRSQGKGARSCGGIVVTVIVVAGIASLVYLYLIINPPKKPIPHTDGTPVSTSTAVRFIFTNEESATLLREDGTTERLTREAFAERLKGTPVFPEGSNVATGAVAQFRNRPASRAEPQPWVSPLGTYAVSLGSAQTDGASTLLLARGTDAAQKIVLRDAKATLKDAVLLGWLSDQESVVEVTATSSRALYAVSISGGLKLLARLPENIVYLSARGGDVWYVTAVLGEGIESQPKAPSELHRVDASGKDVLVIRDETHVVTGVLPDPFSSRRRLAYTTDDAKAHILSIESGFQTQVGPRRPLLFLKTGELVARDGFDLVSIDTSTLTVTKIGSVPEGNVDIFDRANLPL